jgi:hypothetical protein
MSSSDRHAILILEGASAYGSLNAFTREVARIIRASDLDVVTLNLLDPVSFNNDLRQALVDYPGRIGAAFSFSGLGVGLNDETSDGNLWQHLHIPMLTWMLDHPSYYLFRHSHPAPAVMRLYTTTDFLDFHRTYVKAPHRTGHCRLGVMSFGRSPKRRQPRAGDVPLILCPKSGGNPKALEETWTYLPRLMQQVIRDAINYYWTDTPRSGGVVPAVLEAADGAGVELRNDLALMTFFVVQVDDYIRRSKADLLFRDVLKLPVHIMGGGFDYIDTAKARATVTSALDYDQLVEKVGQALAVISLNPNIDNECHDRPFMVMGSGALAISDVNPWWEAKFPALLPYSYDFRQRSIAAAVEKVIADPETAAGVAWEESARFCAERPFEKAVMELLEFALMHRYFTFNFETPQPYYFRHGA